MELLNLEIFYRHQIYSAPICQFQKEWVSSLPVRDDAYLFLIHMK